MKYATCSVLLAMTFLATAAEAQTANSSPTAPAPGGLPGTPTPTTRVAPSGRKVGAGPLTGSAQPHKPTGAEIRAQKQLDRDMNICKGC